MPQNPNSSSSSNPATPSSQHSISSSQYPSFGTQFNLSNMTQEQWNQQQYEQQLQQRFQHLQQNSPRYYQNPQPSQQQNPIDPPPVDSPKKTRKKRAAKVASSSDVQDKKIQQWTSEEEELLAKCFVAVFEDPNVGRDQKMRPELVRFPNGKRRMGTSGGNTDLFSQEKRTFPGSTCSRKDEIRELVENREESNGVFADAMQNELRLKQESQQEKNRTVIKFEELRFLVTRTDGLSP
ncbi:hypothetical protein Tco_1491165 [Tanacetum coccineum]